MVLKMNKLIQHIESDSCLEISNYFKPTTSTSSFDMMDEFVHFEYHDDVPHTRLMKSQNPRYHDPDSSLTMNFFRLKKNVYRYMSLFYMFTAINRCVFLEENTYLT